ncbi:MAG: hypothetical protein JSU72_02935 [Deltaproteobacteria bacterium]|nr:MAG: hypothetical protein JSU72_02935 [Deltaproteobacteria bacterium]
MEKFLSQTLGPEWMFKPEAGVILKDWWRMGNRYELEEFFQVNNIGTIDGADLLARWSDKISSQPATLDLRKVVPTSK